MGCGGGAGLSVSSVSSGASPLPTTGVFAQRWEVLQPLGAMCLAMSLHPVNLRCVSSVAKPADGAPAQGELLWRRLESWASLGRQRWR